MERRNFLIGMGSTAAGASALIGSGAFSLVASERTTSVVVEEDSSAYLGLKEIPSSPNESYVDVDTNGHLRIRLDGNNPTEGNGTGVNSDSFTYINDLFQICNQGKQKIKVFIFKQGANDGRAAFYTDSKSLSGSPSPCHAVELEVGDCIDVGLCTYTGDKYGYSSSLSDGDQILSNVWVVALGEEYFNNGNPSSADAEAQLPAEEDVTANDEMPA